MSEPMANTDGQLRILQEEAEVWRLARDHAKRAFSEIERVISRLGKVLDSFETTPSSSFEEELEDLEGTATEPEESLPLAPGLCASDILECLDDLASHCEGEFESILEEIKDYRDNFHLDDTAVLTQKRGNARRGNRKEFPVPDFYKTEEIFPHTAMKALASGESYDYVGYKDGLAHYRIVPEKPNFSSCKPHTARPERELQLARRPRND